MEKSQLLLPLQQISLIMNERSIGILGGGQLACMLQQAAMNFGTSLSILEDSNSVIAAKYTPFFTKGSTLDYETVVEFGKNLKAISIEKEAVNTDALKYLKDIGVKVIPDPESIEIIQDKYRQKEFLLAHSLPALPGQAYASKAEFEKNIPPYPFIIKKRLAGYDGKGVMKISSPEDLKDVFDEPFFSEPLVDILYEISIIAIRDESGRVHCYEPAQMTNLKGSHILDYYIAPPSIDPALYEIAKHYAHAITLSFKYLGVMAIEMMIDTNHKVWINEISPRVHNTGHHTIECNRTSQFDNQIRLLLEYPVGYTTTLRRALTINILGKEGKTANDYRRMLDEVATCSDTYIHWYGKDNFAKGRKLGHVTVGARSLSDLNVYYQSIKRIINAV